MIISINNHTNKCFPSNIQKKVKTITFLKLHEGCFEHSYRMEFEKQKESSVYKITFHLGTGTFCKCIRIF